jgi:hypothetical protein
MMKETSRPFLHKDEQKAYYDGKKCNTFDKRGSDNHV